MELAEFANRVAGIDGTLAVLVARAIGTYDRLSADEIDQVNELGRRLAGEVFFAGDRAAVDQFVASTRVTLEPPESSRLHAV